MVEKSGTASAVAAPRKPVDGLTPSKSAVISSDSARRAEPGTLAYLRETLDDCTAILKQSNDEAKPTLTRRLDLGDFGEHEAEIQYDAGRDRDERGAYSWFHIVALKVNGHDIWPAFDKETQRVYESELAEALAYEARSAEVEV